MYIGKRLIRGLILGASITALPILSQAAILTVTNSFGAALVAPDSETTGAGSETASSYEGSPLFNITVNQFNSTNGVLTGIDMSIVSTREQSVTVSSTDGPNAGGQGQVTSNGFGTSDARIVGSGIALDFPTITRTGSCTGDRRNACTNTTTTTSTATNTASPVAVAVADLNSYVGAGTVNLAGSAPLLQVFQQDDLFTGTEKTSYSLSWNGTLTTAYTYLIHAAPSFNGTLPQSILSIDFGNVFQNAPDPTAGFSIFNLADGNRGQLDLDSITGGSGPFSTTLATFSNLAQGVSTGYTATFDTATLGVFNTSYTLGLSDADIGASSTRQNYSLTLNLAGNVLPYVSAVPEPYTLSLLSIGLLGLGFARRRKQ